MFSQNVYIQAAADLPDALTRVQQLTTHPDFTINNPNRARSVLSIFGMNFSKFHASDGAAYEWMASQILAIDKINPQLSARMAQVFSLWRRFAEPNHAMMRAQLKRMHDEPGLSKDLMEVVSRSIQ